MEKSPRITVYGSSRLSEDEPAYRLAHDLGAALARGGATVITGGYGGAMEAVSRGAAEAGGHVVGVTVDLFEARGPLNRWVKERVHAPDLFDRLRHLVATTDAHVVLEGSLGTLTELFLTWTLASVGALAAESLVLLGERWPLYLEAHGELVPRELFRHVRVARTPSEAATWAIAAARSRPQVAR
ncbi:MAG: LOG family protein [Candidatus Eisenbacteria bacterium]|uniref:LOG family protein n=1 Tax=Eiseniibacteriota bacterium TaxID=2212470 RepID=A0A538U5I7_UNCEI|nr:MAG: LOG family protein [Candidatus Eisenbacteria bacterium]